MNNRPVINCAVLESLQEREERYGIEFITAQLQSASPANEVVTAIKDRMVAVQRLEQSEAESAQIQILADGDYYAAQKKLMPKYIG